MNERGHALLPLDVTLLAWWISESYNGTIDCARLESGGSDARDGSLGGELPSGCVWTGAKASLKMCFGHSR
jgi:hypothetical protein